MSSVKRSISLTPELAEILDRLASERGEDRSRLIEILLRENPTIRREVQDRRQATAPPLKRGRSLTELKLLARTAQAQWERDAASGKVRLPGRS